MIYFPWIWEDDIEFRRIFWIRCGCLDLADSLIEVLLTIRLGVE